MQTKTLDEILTEEGLLFDYDAKEDLEEAMPYIMERDNIAISLDANQKARVLSGRISQFKDKVHRITDGSLPNKIHNAASRFYKNLTGKEEATLIDNYNSIMTISTELQSSLGMLLKDYESEFERLDAIYRKQSLEIMYFIESKGKFLLRNSNHKNLLKETSSRLNKAKTPEGLSKDEIKYSDEKANIEFKMKKENGGMDIILSRIKNSIEIKNRLNEERFYHQDILNSYIEALSLCEKIVEFFGASVPLHISSTYLIRNAKELVNATDELYGLSQMLHTKTEEGLSFITNFNKNDVFAKAGRKLNSVFGKNNGDNFSTKSYVRGLLKP